MPISDHFADQMALWYQNLQQNFLRIALSPYYELHTRKEGADRKGVTLGGFVPFLSYFSDLMKLHELQMNNFHSTEYLDVSNTMPSDMTYAAKMKITSAEKELENGKSNVLGCQ